jgi:membrane protease YdiL (CAAX protease family)
MFGLAAFASLAVGGILLLERYLPGFLDTTANVTLSFAIVREGLLLIAIVLPTGLMARAERRNFLSYGLSGRHRLRYLIVGLMWGLVCASLLVVGLFATGHLVFGKRLLSTTAAAEYGLAWAGCFLLVGLAEEMLFRGYLQFALARLIGFWPAAVVLSVLFGMVHLHNSNEVLFGAAVVALGGAFFTLGLWRTGSLWWGIGFHTAWDWSQSFLYGTADSGILIANRLMQAQPVGAVILSGGSAGPEGSILILPVMTLALAIMFFTPSALPRRQV